VPIVRRTGGLADTVIPFQPSTAQAKVATGFHFVDASTDALLSAIVQSLQIYREQENWRTLMEAGMRTDVSWRQAAKQYVQVYGSVVKGDETKKKES
jgi:starch synthase